jgi:hypothetical protein
MGITVNNASGNEAIFKDFVGWSLRRMLIEDFYDNIAVGINLTFTDDVLKRDRWGELIPVKHEGDTRPLRFDINVAQTYQMMRSLRLIAHECAHVAQMVSGRYYYDSVNDQIYWQRKPVDEDQYQAGFEPWEIEARGLEFCLVEAYIQDRGYENERWYQPLD